MKIWIFGKCLSLQNKNQSSFLSSATTLSGRAQETGGKVLHLIVKVKISRPLSESLISQAHRKIINTKFGAEEANRKVVTSKQSYRYTENISDDIEPKLIQRLEKAFIAN